jgi:hypothetical protein
LFALLAVSTGGEKLWIGKTGRKRGKTKRKQKFE